MVFSEKVKAYDYEITNFNSQIKLEQDSSLTIKEKIETKFLTAKHGIFRIIPYIYNHKGKTLNANIKILSVKDKLGNSIPFTVSNYNQSKKIQIGNANKLVKGSMDYIIEYNIGEVVLDYGLGPEIYWNVTGNEWDVPIKKVEATVESPFGKIIKTECFGCQNTFSDKEANFYGKEGLTIVVQIDKNNSIKMPGIVEQKAELVKDNFGYILAILPLLLMFLVWYFKGRDKKYLTENFFYEPEKKNEINTPLINRPHLPLVYGPIDKLTPGEAGTINDEKFDTKDAVAEIVELARLGYLTIKKVEKKGVFGIKTRDYELTKTDKSTELLKKYQIYLLESLFNIDIGTKKITDKILEPVTVKISNLKNHFYVHLNKLREKIYQQMILENIFPESPDSARVRWISLTIVLNTLMSWIIVIFFVKITNNAGPILVELMGAVFSLVLAWNMPRKTAKGYSLNRQTVGLKYYLSKGKWREEIAEKELFLEEMLPLAIALGVVDKLANDMKDLGVEAPKYFQGMAMNSFASDLNHFSASAADGLTSAPTNYSGSGSWSGGSGFSGGGGGGGFGGGGGGSW